MLHLFSLLLCSAWALGHPTKKSIVKLLYHYHVLCVNFPPSLVAPKLLPSVQSSTSILDSTFHSFDLIHSFPLLSFSFPFLLFLCLAVLSPVVDTLIDSAPIGLSQPLPVLPLHSVLRVAHRPQFSFLRLCYLDVFHLTKVVVRSFQLFNPHSLSNLGHVSDSRLLRDPFTLVYTPFGLFQSSTRLRINPWVFPTDG